MGTTRTGKRGLLRTNADFRRLWTAGAVSQLGTWISGLAIPLFALLELHATVLQVALLTTLRTLSALLVGLPAGAWCDRLRCRPVMVAADLGRMVLFGSIPVAAALHASSIGQLYVVVFLGGVLTVFFDVSNQSYVPRLVGRADLVEGNARLQMNQSVAATVGPTIAGLLVQWLTAPFAVGADALSYLVSALRIRAIRSPEAKPAVTTRPALLRDIKEGLTFVFGHSLIRSIALYMATEGFFQSAGFMGLLTVLLVGPLHLRPSAIGLLGGLGMLGAIAGSLVAERVAEFLGKGRCLFASGLAMGVGALLVPLAEPGWRLGCYVVGDAILGFSIILSVVTETSLCQLACPDELRGRMNATLRFLYGGAMPLGSLVGGIVASAIGVRPTMWFAALGILLSALWLIRPATSAPIEAP
ncbi:MAG TPA: MFS transporter [Pseudonocardiaceae bacterium]|nr:MFS transporter [Pseudonocardiaceae bacterium]